MKSWALGRAGIQAAPKNHSVGPNMPEPRELWKRVEVGELRVMNQLWVLVIAMGERL